MPSLAVENEQILKFDVSAVVVQVVGDRVSINEYWKLVKFAMALLIAEPTLRF